VHALRSYWVLMVWAQPRAQFARIGVTESEMALKDNRQCSQWSEQERFEKARQGTILNNRDLSIALSGFIKSQFNFVFVLWNGTV
jgi:hypothetical protein